MSKAAEPKPEFKSAAEAQKKITAARAFLTTQEQEAIKFLDEDAGLLEFLKKSLEDVDNASAEDKVKSIRDALLYIEGMNLMADGREKINERIFKKYITPLIEILKSIKFSDDFSEATKNSTNSFKSNFRKNKALRDKFAVLNNDLASEEEIREWLNSIVRLYIDSYSQTIGFNFLHPRITFYKEISGGRKKRGHTTGLPKKTN